MTRRQGSWNRVIGGRKAKNRGTAFENLFRAQFQNKGIFVLRFPDGCERRGMTAYGRPRLVAVKTPFDWILSIPGRSAYIDTKTTGGNTFVYSAIVQHQIEALHQLEFHGHIAGYVVHFQNTQRVVFFWASHLARLNSGEGLRPEQGFDLGTLYQMEPMRLFGIYPTIRGVRQQVRLLGDSPDEGEE